MTPQELREKRCRILMDLTDKGDEYDDDLFVTLNQLEGLDTEYARSQQNPYYAFLNTLDRNTNALKQAEGNPAEEHAAIDLDKTRFGGDANRWAAFARDTFQVVIIKSALPSAKFDMQSVHADRLFDRLVELIGGGK